MQKPSFFQKYYSTEKPKGGKKVIGEVRFGVYILRESRSAESRRRKVQQITTTEPVKVIGGLGMIRKIGASRYQFRGIIFDQKRGELMFDFVLTKEELEEVFPLQGISGNITIPGVGRREGKGFIVRRIEFFFEVEDFLRSEVHELMTNGPITRRKKWHD